MQGSDSKCTGISVPARKHAISVAGYIAEAKTIFAFNVTYNRQAQKAFQAISEKIEDSIENKSFIKLWKILPYKESYGGILIDSWIETTFPNVSVEKVELKKMIFS